MNPYTIDERGHIEEVPAPNPQEGYNLKELYKLTESDIIEIVRLHGRNEGQILVIDEEGLLDGKAPNMKASVLAGQPIMGKVLVCKDEHVK